MRISRMISVVVLIAVSQIAAFGQPQSSSFEPFDRWSAAVLAGLGGDGGLAACEQGERGNDDADGGSHRAPQRENSFSRKSEARAIAMRSIRALPLE